MRVLIFILSILFSGIIKSQDSQMDKNYIRLEGISSLPGLSSLNNDTRVFLLLKNNSVAHNATVALEAKVGSSLLGTRLEHCAREYGLQWFGDTYAGFGQLFGQDHGIIIRTGSQDNPEGVIKFMTGYDGNGSSYERARINKVGNFGLGIEHPKTKLHLLNGDIFIDNSPNETVNGIIMKSPGGFCFRITIDDNGSFVNSGKITCP